MTKEGREGGGEGGILKTVQRQQNKRETIDCCKAVNWWNVKEMDLGSNFFLLRSWKERHTLTIRERNMEAAGILASDGSFTRLPGGMRRLSHNIGTHYKARVLYVETAIFSPMNLSNSYI